LPAYRRGGIRQRGIRSRRHHRDPGNPGAGRRITQCTGDPGQGPKFGAIPELIADFLALTGDSVDNIPGVPGVGKKTAALLFSAFGSLDDLYENLHRVPQLKLRGGAAVAARLLAHKQAAYLARRLTGIVCDMPLKASLDDLKVRAPDRGRLDRFFDTHGFGSILRQQARRIAAA
jgi:5'-3' exonuclease